MITILGLAFCMSDGSGFYSGYRYFRVCTRRKLKAWKQLKFFFVLTSIDLGIPRPKCVIFSRDMAFLYMSGVHVFCPESLTASLLKRAPKMPSVGSVSAWKIRVLRERHNSEECSSLQVHICSHSCMFEWHSVSWQSVLSLHVD